MIEVNDLVKRYGTLEVLRGVTLSVDPGEVAAIIGPSGSGKSTFLRCLNGLETFQGGTVTIDGLHWGVETPASARGRILHAVRGRVGMVFQSFNLFPHLTVLENCMLPLVRVKRLPTGAARERALDFLAKVRVADQSAKHPAQLSGGQQQRVAIARAIAMGPALLLCDEPTSALDPELVDEVLETLMALAAEGMTMAVVTHEMGFARRFATEVVFMDTGRIIERSAPEAFFSAPREGRTRDFLRKVV